MDITYFGHSSFRLRGKTATLVTDPYDSDMVGLKFPKHTEADIVTISHDHEDHNKADMIEGSPFIIKGPGEYEVKGVGIVGVSVFHDEEKGAKRGRSTMYRIEMDGINIVHLGDLGHMLNSQEVDALDGVHVLMVPVGGFFTINAAKAVEVINEIEPSIAIPMHYGRSELNQKQFGELAGLDQFFKEIGKEPVAPVPKLVLSKDKLPAEMSVVVFQ